MNDPMTEYVIEPEKEIPVLYDVDVPECMQ